VLLMIFFNVKNSFETVFRGKLLVLTQQKPNYLGAYREQLFYCSAVNSSALAFLLTLAIAVPSITKDVDKSFDIFSNKFGYWRTF